MNTSHFKKIVLSIFLACSLLTLTSFKTQQEEIYLDRTKPVEQRVADLMSKMTLEEKVAQMCQYLSPRHIINTDKVFKNTVPKNSDANGTYPTVSTDSIYKLVERGLIGSFLHVLTSDESNHLQKSAQKSRLKIPLLIGIDAIHGAGFSSGTTIYPSAITQASSFNTELVEKAAQESALEIRAMGSSWTFTPNVDVCRDPRWGRIGETFGEDPYLVSQMGIATVKGLQGDKLGANSVAACLKHLVAGGEPINGLNSSPMEVSPYTLNDIFLYPFKKVIENTNVSTIMTAHNELNGIPCHANKNLMTETVRKNYNFNGFYVSDWLDIERLNFLHRYAPNMNEAYYESVNAGMDMHMHGPGFLQGVIKLVNEKRLSEERINESCARILQLKFRLGLFENPFTDVENTKNVVFTPDHQNTALKLAEQSIVLLKNNGLLPLDFSKYKNILVTGPNANSHSILGDWALKQPNENVTTILKGIQEIAGNEKVHFYNLGTNVRFDDVKLLNEAANLAKKSDLAIVVVGENTMRYDGKLTSSGENNDRMQIDLLGLQDELVKRIYETGVPTVVILVGGRPLAINWIAKNVPAIIQSWESGSLGGLAVANVLSGKVNPSGKLPVTIPHNSGQIQTIYNYKTSYYFKDYKDGDTSPLYPFGFGLSYTNFEISNMTVSKTEFSTSESIEVTADIMNVGNREGAEVVQLYICDLFSQPTRPVKELKGFTKVSLNPGEKRKIHFSISPETLSFTLKNMEWGVEAGEFDIMVGTSSLDKDLKKITVNVK